MFMKPTTDRMLNRIKDVYMFILDKGVVSTQDLVEEFNITPRTIQRDLNVLAFNDLVMSPSRGKWTTTKKKVKLTS
jgi:DeoR/GlpR family transcriptional regulator of sugar metabolism